MTEIESGVFDKEFDAEMLPQLLRALEEKHGPFEIAIPKDGEITITNWWLLSLPQRGIETRVVVFGTSETYRSFRRDNVQ